MLRHGDYSALLLQSTALCFGRVQLFASTKHRGLLSQSRAVLSIVQPFCFDGVKRVVPTEYSALVRKYIALCIGRVKRFVSIEYAALLRPRTVLCLYKERRSGLVTWTASPLLGRIQRCLPLTGAVLLGREQHFGLVDNRCFCSERRTLLLRESFS